MTANEAIEYVENRGQHRTRYEGQELSLTEALVAEIRRLRNELRNKASGLYYIHAECISYRVENEYKIREHLESIFGTAHKEHGGVLDSDWRWGYFTYATGSHATPCFMDDKLNMRPQDLKQIAAKLTRTNPMRGLSR